MASNNSQRLNEYEAKLKRLEALEAERAQITRDLGMTTLQAHCKTIVTVCNKMSQGTATEADIKLFWEQIKERRMQRAIRAVYPQPKD